MFDIFKRKKKPASDPQKTAETTETPIENDVVNTELSDTDDQQNNPAVIVEEAPVAAAEMPKAGIPASDETVFFQDSAELEDKAEKDWI